MNLEQQVCSLDLAKRLKELGVKQESHLHWWESTYNGGFVVASRREIDRARDKQMSDDTSDWVLAYSAFTVAELGEILPTEITQYLKKTSRGWLWRKFAMITTDIYIPDIFTTEADARTKMLIYLIENKLIPV